MNRKGMCALAAVLLAIVPAVYAQTSSGAMSGIVTDPSGLAVNQARITLTNLGTSESHVTNTGDTGLYQFPVVLPGRYRVQVEMTGFKRSVREPVIVEVQSSVKLDFTLELGETTQTVQVSGGQTPLVQTDNAALGQVVEQRSVTELPLNGRNVFSLLALSASVVPMGGSGTTPTGGNAFAWANFSIGGGIAAQAAEFLDGQLLNLPYLDLPAFVPVQDSIQEFKVLSNNLGPEWGKFGGGVVTLYTKAGTNALHGTVYEFLRNKQLNATNFFSNRSGLVRPPFAQNEFGANAGGRAIKDKTFWFVQYEGMRLRQGVTYVETVPTAQQLGGNFQGIANIYDALTTCGYAGGPSCATGQATGTRVPFPNNAIPASRIEAASSKLMSLLLPPPTNPNLNTNNYVANASTGGDNDQVVARVDQVISSKQTLFARFTRWTNWNLAADPYHTGVCAAQCDEHMKTNALALGYTYSITPQLLLEIPASVSRFVYLRVPKLANFDLTTLGSGWTPAMNAVIPSIMRTPPVLSITGIDNPAQPVMTGTSQGQGSYLADNDTQYNLMPSLTWMKGRHSLKFGGQWIPSFDTYTVTNYATGLFTFTGGFTASTPTNNASGLGFASYLLGYASGGVAWNAAEPAAKTTYSAWYVGDTWRVTNKLTITPGMRFELEGPYTERYNRLSYFDPSATNVMGAAAGMPNLKGDLGLVGSAGHPSRSNIPNGVKMAPRFGVAYQVTPNIVVRTGYGVFWLPVQLSNNIQPSFDAIESAYTYMNASINGSGAIPLATLANAFPSLVLPNGRDPAFMQYLEGSTVRDINGKWHPNAYAQQWNFDIQTQLPAGFFLDTAYAGSKGTHMSVSSGSLPSDVLPDQYLSMGSALNQSTANPFYGIVTNPGTALYNATTTVGQLLRPYPEFANVSFVQQGAATVSYHALEVSLRRRFKGNGTFLAAYTFSKSIGTSTTSDSWLENGSTGGAGSFQDYNNLGLERAVTPSSVPSRLVVSYVIDLPFGRGQKFLGNAHGVAGKLVSGWGIDGISTFQSGFSDGLLLGTSNSIANFGNGTTRPNITCPNASLSGPAQTRLSKWFNTSCFTAPPDFTYGNEPRLDHYIRQAGINNFDFSVFKSTNFGPEGRYGIQFRTEVFNLFNRVQFGPPNTTLGTSIFGQVTSQVNNPRLIQMALRFQF